MRSLNGFTQVFESFIHLAIFLTTFMTRAHGHLKTTIFLKQIQLCDNSSQVCFIHSILFA